MKPKKFSKPNSAISWLRKYWAIVFILALFIGIIIIFMIGGLNFTQAVQFSFESMIRYYSATRGSDSNYQSFINVAAIVSLIVIAIIIYGVIRYRSRK